MKARNGILLLSEKVHNKPAVPNTNDSAAGLVITKSKETRTVILKLQYSISAIEYDVTKKDCVNIDS